MRINTNVSSLVAQEASVNTSKNLAVSLEKLSSGLRINKASDDASGLAIADKLRTQATSINQGISNGNSAISLLQIADKSMSEQSSILDTIKAKLIQANTNTTSADGRESIRKDIKKLLEQLDNIAEQTNYNGNVLLQKSSTERTGSNALSFQVGEKNNDIITNNSIQSNTSGLGSKVVYSADSDNNKIAGGSTTTLSGSSAISLTSTTATGSDTAEAISLSGDIDTLNLAVGTTISGLDSASKAAFESQAGTLGTDYTKSGTSYTMLSAKNIDLSAVTGTKTANITTAAESSSSYSAQIGDKVTSSTVTAGSALSTALADATKFTHNLDGTYTAKANGSFTLKTGESVGFSRATTEANVTSGQTVTLGANVVAGSELATALTDSTKFTKISGTAGQSGAVYTANANVSNLGIDDVESISITTAAVAAPATNLSLAVGDMITLTAAAGTGSALETALNDTTKFEKISGTMGAAASVYKAIAASTTALTTGENISKSAATTVNINQGGAYPAGSSLTLNAAPVTGSDLANQLANTAKFTYAGGAAAGTSGAVYTVKDDFTSNNVKLVAGESITMSAATSMTIPAADISGATIDDGSVTYTPNGGAPVSADYTEGTGKVSTQGAATDLMISQKGILNFDVTAAATNDTFKIKAGDTVSITTDAGAAGAKLTSNQIIESADFVDNGNGTYTATADKTITFGNATDKINVRRPVGQNLSTATTPGSAATTVSKIDTPASTNTVAGEGNTTGTISPSPTVAVTFSTSSTVNVTNNGSASNTLTMTSASEMSNGGTQLSALADVNSGEFTAEKSSSFQTVVDDAITKLNGYRGDIGSTQNQVESAVRNLMTQATNVKAAESIIRDVDYAAESANFNKQNIISQAGSYAISQSNSVQQNVLRLLQ